MSEFVKWEDVKARRRVADTRSDAERAVAKQAARVRLKAYERGHQLAELRRKAQLTQREVAERLGVSQSRVSQIESGEVSTIEAVRDYAAAVGGEADFTLRFRGESWAVA